MNKIKFNIKGAYGETNFGDDLLMLVFENYFRKEFSNAIINFEGEKSDYPNVLLQKSTYNKKIDYDWLIYGGGTQFFAFQETYKSSIFQKIKLGISNPKLIFDKLKIAEKPHNIKTGFLGFGLGPFNDNQKVINYAKGKLSNANFVGVRDKVSHNYCNEWNIDSFLGADVVFSSYFDDILLEKPIQSFKKKIGIIVRDWDFDDTGNLYISKLREINKLNIKEFEYQIIVFAPFKDKKSLKEFKNDSLLIWNPEKDSVLTFLNKLNCFDLIISARYHGAIIGALLNKPVICIEIEPKLRILTEQVEEFYLWKKPFIINDLEQIINKIDFDNIDYTKSLNERKEKANNMLSKFKEQLS